MEGYSKCLRGSACGGDLASLITNCNTLLDKALLSKRSEAECLWIGQLASIQRCLTLKIDDALFYLT